MRYRSPVAIGATKPLGQVQPEQARVAQLVPVLAVDLMLASPAFLVRGGFLGQELGSVFAQLAMLVCLPARSVSGKSADTANRLIYPPQYRLRFA
jgi:hypothetical protein